MSRRQARRSRPRPRKPSKTVTGPRTGAPAADSVKAIVEFTSPGGRRYRIIKTTETDAYDTPPADRKPAARNKRKK